MLVDAAAEDIIYTPAVSGVPASFLRPSLVRAGLDPDHLEHKTKLDLGEELSGSKAWRDIWSAGQGVGQIDDVVSVSVLCERLISEYRNTCKRMADGYAS